MLVFACARGCARMCGCTQAHTHALTLSPNQHARAHAGKHEHLHTNTQISLPDAGERLGLRIAVVVDDASAPWTPTLVCVCECVRVRERALTTHTKLCPSPTCSCVRAYWVGEGPRPVCVNVCGGLE